CAFGQRGQHGLSQDIVNSRRPRIDEQHDENGQHGHDRAQQAGAQLDQVGNESLLQGGSVLCHVGVPVLFWVSSKPGSGSVSVSGSAGSGSAGGSASGWDTNSFRASGSLSLASALALSTRDSTEAEASFSACWASSSGARRLLLASCMDDLTDLAASSIWPFRLLSSSRSISRWMSDLTSPT